MKDFIGVFDSGIGGLTVFKIIEENLKCENIVYLADTANCPYGEKSLEEVRKITLKNIEYLKNLGAKAIVIACNTATSSIIDMIDDSNGFLTGVIEPTAYEALKVSKSKRIGLFATNLTVSTKIYERYLTDATVYSEGCSDFVLPIENGDFHSEELQKMIRNHASHLELVDTLILGCTHFPHIKDEIEKVLPDVSIVESGKPTLEVLKKYLEKKNLLAVNNGRKLTFLTTGKIDNAKRQLDIFNNHFDEIKKIEI